MPMKSVLFPSIAAALATAPAQARTVTLAPSSKWAISFDDEGCRLARVLGEGDDQTTMIMIRNRPGSSGDHMVIAGRPVGNIQERHGVEVGFGPGTDINETRPYRGSLGEIEPALIFSSVSIRPEREASQSDQSKEDQAALRAESRKLADSVTYMTVADRSDELRFDFGSMKDVNTVMDDCANGLIEAWGLDAEKHASAMREPVPLNAQDWIRSSDYPRGYEASRTARNHQCAHDRRCRWIADRVSHPEHDAPQSLRRRSLFVDPETCQLRPGPGCSGQADEILLSDQGTLHGALTGPVRRKRHPENGWSALPIRRPECR